MTALQRWIVGSSTQCDVVIQEPIVSGRHCVITQTTQGFMLEDAHSTNGTFVNGVRVDEPVLVGPTDVVTLGTSVVLPWEQFQTTDEISPSNKTSVTEITDSRDDQNDVYRTPIHERPTPATVAQTDEVFTIGQAADNDIVLDYPVISSHHARLLKSNGQIILEDLGSTNGTAIGTPQNRIDRAQIRNGDVVYFGSFRISAERLVEGHAKIGHTTQGTVSMDRDETILGRDESCDVVLPFPMISSRHARLSKQGSSVVVEDLGSLNGTFVNGRRLSGPVVVQAGDVIGLGSYTLEFTGDGQFKTRDYNGNLAIEVQNLSIDVPGKRLLENLSLTIFPSEFVGLMGPSGAGKTTLMNAMNGYTPPSEGHVLFNCQDLYANYGQFSGLMGYVPQDDIIHRELTVEQALFYTAKLRLPPDTTDAEIYQRIDKVLKQLELEGQRNTQIGSPERKLLSGGQRKRVNLAMELLTDPPVLFLDEPTSGLSSEDTMMVMKVLRELANSGKTILLTIHQPSLEAFRLMDNLVLVSKDANSPDPGTLAYYGPAYPNAVEFFNPDGVDGLKPGAEPLPDEVLRGLVKRKSREWSERYKQSEYCREYVTKRAGQLPMKLAPHVESSPAMIGQQWWTLVQRLVTIKLSDRWNTTFLLAQAPIVGVLIAMVFGSDLSDEISSTDLGKWREVANSTAVTIFWLGFSALWFGCSNSVREVVGEWAIYHRERMVNLKIPAYVASKFTVLGALCFLQCAILTTIVYFGCDMKAGFISLFSVVMLIALIGLGIGLIISSFARTTEAAITLLPLVLIPIGLLGGAMKPVHEMHDAMEYVAMANPSRWGFEGMLLLESEERPKFDNSAGRVEENANSDDITIDDMAEGYFPQNDRVGVGASAAVLLLMFATCVSAILAILRARDVH